VDKAPSTVPHTCELKFLLRDPHLQAEAGNDPQGQGKNSAIRVAFFAERSVKGKPRNPNDGFRKVLEVSN
jgi:hypothetical protein